VTALEELLGGLLDEETPEHVGLLTRALRSGALALDSGGATLQRSIPGSAPTHNRIRSLLSSWAATGGTADSLASVLNAGMDVRRKAEDRGPACELVWTGPVGAGGGVRSTAEVVREMLESPKRTVVVVAYSVWLGAAAKGVVARLAELSTSEVRVRFLLDERYQEGWSIQQIRRAWPSAAPPPSLFTWEAPEDEIAKLHAKVLLVDGRDLLITSANLTEHGLAGNLEFGVRIRGTPAVDADKHFESLLRSSLVRKIDW
jgi:hypothetical protein